MPRVKLNSLVLCDTHQPQPVVCTTTDILPICYTLNQAGFFALEALNTAAFDSCIRFLNEDPWERLKKLKAELPDTPLMMPFHAQTLLGKCRQSDEVITKFVECAANNGIEFFCVFDISNDLANFNAAAAAIKNSGRHFQAAISYNANPFNTNGYIELARQFAELGADSICVKDSAGTLNPYDGYNLVKEIKQAVNLPVEIRTDTDNAAAAVILFKCAEAGADILDTEISCAETIAKIYKNNEYDTGLELSLLPKISEYFNELRKKYKPNPANADNAAAPDNEELYQQAGGYEKLEDDTKKLLNTDSVITEDVLTYAMFPGVAPAFFKKRPEGPVPSGTWGGKPEASARYTVQVNGASYDVVVAPAFSTGVS